MNGDLISRSALIQHAYSAVVDGVEKDIIDLSDVDNAPTVFDDKAYSDGYTQGTCDCEHAHERPQGEWRRDVVGLYCSICQGRAFVTGTNYCPFCGAAMGGAES